VLLSALIPNPKKFDLSLIESVYTGKAGCMCGCKGNHTENRNSFRYVLNKVIELQGEADIFPNSDGSNGHAYRGARDDERCRAYVVYFKPGVLEELMVEAGLREAQRDDERAQQSAAEGAAV
jgi:hypothetical protein